MPATVESPKFKAGGFEAEAGGIFNVPYDRSRTLPLSNAPLSVPGRGVMITATVAGNVRLTLGGSGTVDVAVPVGTVIIHDVAVVSYVAAGTTATFTGWVLDNTTSDA